MKTIPHYSKHLLAVLCSSCLIAHGTAGNLNLADNALEVVDGVPANVMLVIDNSGSMDYETTISHTKKNLFIMHQSDAETASDTWRSMLFADSSHWVSTSSIYGRIVPSEEAMLSHLGVSSDPFGVWRARYHGYNSQYYNPDTTYLPWKGTNINNATYTDADTGAALYDPWDPGNSSTWDLTSNLADYTAQGPTSTSDYTPADITVQNYYPARYYTWTDTDGDGNVDPGDGHTRVEITSTFCSTNNNCQHPVYDETSGEGRRDCGADSDGDGLVTCTYAQEIQNFANWFQYYRSRHLAAKAALSHTLEDVTTTRVGMATINDPSSNRIEPDTMNASSASSEKEALLEKVFGQYPSNGGTPLRQRLYETNRYIACEGSDIFGGSGSCLTNEGTSADECRQNYVVMVSDGYYSGSLSGTRWSTNHDNDNDTDYDGGAFADGYTETLADIAMYYYENDIQGSIDDEVPTTARDSSLFLGSGSLGDTIHQHIATYMVAFGLDGTISSMPGDKTTAFAWPQPTSGTSARIDDMRHAAYNGRGNFFNAANPTSLVSSMQEIFEEIQEGNGAASAVAFNTQNLESGSLVFRAFFDTTQDTGDVVAQRVNLDGSIDSTYLWSAAEELDSKAGNASDNRILITYNDTGSNTSEGIPFDWSDLAGGQQTELQTPVPGAYSRGGDIGEDRLEYLRGQTQYEGTNDSAGEFRERKSTAGKLGDIVHSAPVFVGEPPYNGRNTGAFPQGSTSALYSTFKDSNSGRRELVYIGANDGILHAFDADTGEEVFGYVPNILMSELSDLTSPNYNHQFYVDLTPSINDVYMTPSSGSLSWRSVLVGGLGAGGKGYYALDITDPGNYSTESGAADQVMWEFTEADDGGVGSSDLGYTFSQPLIAMSNADDGSGNQKWVAIIGNGYNSTSADGDAALYILFLEGGLDGVWTAGTDYIKVSTGNGKAESSDGTTPNGLSGIRGIDDNGDGTVDYVYAGDLQGNLYRFDLTDTTPSNWNNSTILFQARYGTSFPRNTVQPITNRPIVTPHPTDPGYIVIVGTGSWMTTGDATDTSIQSIYGVWDDMSNSPLVEMSSTTNQLVEQEFTNHASQEHGVTVRSLTSNTISWKNNGNANNKVKGWYIDLNVPEAGGGAVEFPGERAVRQFRLRGGLLFVNTVIPKSTAECATGPGGFTLAFDPETGGAPDDPIFDLDGDGTFDTDDNIGDASGSANVVTGTRHEDATPADASFIGDVLVTQRSDKTLESRKTNTGSGTSQGRQSWRELAP